MGSHSGSAAVKETKPAKRWFGQTVAVFSGDSDIETEGGTELEIKCNGSILKPSFTHSVVSFCLCAYLARFKLKPLKQVSQSCSKTPHSSRAAPLALVWLETSETTHFTLKMRSKFMRFCHTLFTSLRLARPFPHAAVFLLSFFVRCH